MKLVLKYEEDVRLYSEELTFHRLLAFVEREFPIEGQNIEITFTDEDGDNITIASEDDIAIVEDYFKEKQYVKLNVRGQKKEIKEPQHEEDDCKEQEKVEAPKQKKKKKSENNKSAQKPKKEAKKDGKEKKVKKDKQIKIDAKTVEIKELLNLTVVELVDERLRAMIPCLREQLSKPAEIKQADNGHPVHEGYECSRCFQSPIVGIRYQCPVCEDYNVCDICEGSNEHQHNLLKIRNLVQKPQKKQNNRIDNLCKLLLQRTDQLAAKRQKEEKKKQAQKDLQKENMKQAKRYLSQLFGNQPKFYNEFTKKHKNLSVEETVKEYASTQSITNDELYARVIDLQCQRLSNKFKKQPHLYKDFVSEHFNFDLDAILKIIYKQGLEKKEKKKQKSKPAKNTEDKQKEEVKIQKKEEVVNIEKEEEANNFLKKEENPQVLELSVKVERKEEQKPKKEVSELKGGKQEILNLMIQFFGKGRKDDYIKFIALNQRHSKQDIVQMWADSFSIIKP